MRPLRVLIFDDDLVNHQAFLSNTLERLNARRERPVEVMYRGHADDAVDDVRAHEADVVFMDFQMGVHDDGATATKALREVFDYDALPIVGISSDSRFNQLIVQAGATESCVKMSLPDKLAAILELVAPTSR